MTTEQALRAALDLLARVADAVPAGTKLPPDFDDVYDKASGAIAG